MWQLCAVLSCRVCPLVRVKSDSLSDRLASNDIALVYNHNVGYLNDLRNEWVMILSGLYNDGPTKKIPL